MADSCLMLNRDSTAPAPPPGINLAIKVDVDTLVGTEEGVPRLMDIFNIRGIRASFFLSVGPDNSGRAIWRIFRPGFITKMFRTKAPGTYGLKTMLMGTLLPAPVIGRGREWLVRNLTASGHEVGLHAWDHVTWHDRLWRMSAIRVKTELKMGIDALTRLAGERPRSFAAPAWRISLPAVETLEKSGMAYMSGTRGRHPYRPAMYGCSYNIMEIPTTLPTADEVLGTGGITAENIDRYFLDRILTPGLHVWTIHAEMEGRGLSPALEKILDTCLEKGVRFHRLADIADFYQKQETPLPCMEVVKAEIPGRAGLVSMQKI